MRNVLAIFLLASPVLPFDEYTLGPDSRRKPGVPQGKVTRHVWRSAIFPGTVRDYWIYVPAQYKPDQPAAVMVFQDGAGYVSEEGHSRAPIVFDNLIHAGEMPVTVGIFINPGVMPARHAGEQARYNRSFEYDAVSDRYARFLIDEILPEVGRTYNLTRDPNLRAIAGSSSGGSCAFTAAWHRPDAFRRVLSFIGSFTNLRGANQYASLVRKTEPRPLRVFLQDGTKDQNIYAGNWYLANEDLHSALAYSGYDVKFVTGSEGHNMKHGGAILPDALRWLWREWSRPITKSQSGGDRHYLLDILEPGQDWELVSQGHRFTEGPAVDKDGNVFFTDVPNSRIHRIAPDGAVTLFKEDTGSANGLMFGPDGRLYACQNGRKRIVAYSRDGAESVIAEGVTSNDIVVNRKGEIYFTDPPGRQVWFVDATGDRRVVISQGLEFPNGIALSPDQSLLLVADSRARWVWSYQVQEDGSVANGVPFHRLETLDDSTSISADGIKTDSEGYLYVTTRLGLQVLDQPGRTVGIIAKPHPGPLSNVVFAGPDLQTLYVTAGDRVYKRRIRRKGVLPWTVARPPQPRL